MGSWPDCPECGHPHLEIIGEFRRGGNRWQTFHCLNCISDICVPENWSEMEAWCPGCGEPADREAVRAGVESPCDNEECPVPRFEPWHEHYEAFSRTSAGDESC